MVNFVWVIGLKLYVRGFDSWVLMILWGVVFLCMFGCFVCLISNKVEVFKCLILKLLFLNIMYNFVWEN